MRGRCYIRHGSGQSSWFLGESRRNDVFDRTKDIREDDPAAFERGMEVEGERPVEGPRYADRH